MFAERGGGVLLYMAQEGRDIGLANKLRAYRLQADGLDTIDADETLGFDADERNCTEPRSRFSARSACAGSWYC